jgi:predicted nucleic acid-binding protein
MIVIDTNTFSSISNETANDYAEFKPIIHWVKTAGGACFVYGGTKYKAELIKVRSMLALFDQFKKANKVVTINSDLIDAYEAKLEGINQQAAFNDKHLVSVIEISNCRLLCTKDEEAMPFIKDAQFYETSSPPKLYTGERNRDLLVSGNIVELRNVVG